MESLVGVFKAEGFFIKGNRYFGNSDSQRSFWETYKGETFQKMIAKRAGCVPRWPAYNSTKIERQQKGGRKGKRYRGKLYRRKLGNREKTRGDRGKYNEGGKSERTDKGDFSLVQNQSRGGP